MANVLPKDKQIAIISALAEGSSMRSISRMTGVHRDTICRLGVRIGQGCAALLDAKMRDLRAIICNLTRFGDSSARRKSISLSTTIRRLVMFGRSALLTPKPSSFPHSRLASATT